MAPPRRWGFLSSLLALSPVLLVTPFLVLRVQYALPEPLLEPFDPATGLPQVSESNVLALAKYLSEDIGYRTPGTAEHALGDAYMFDQAKAFTDECNAIAKKSGRALECEVWRQQGSGAHRFDMMGKRLYKSYKNLSNIIIRISDGTEAGKTHAILANAHLDSTLPSPGAADDALSCGVLLEVGRVLVNTPSWTPTHAIILLFNNAEESLQDGSHLYSTQHTTASTVRAVINLEAAGTKDAELLFQATSNEMIEAYSRVPRPMGTVVAADVFKTGIMLSDTDFRQFVEYLNVTGLDLAVVGNSYLYHMRKDLVENIQPGVAQHMGENTLALLRYLSSSESPLPSLANGATSPSTVYFSYLGGFVKYTAQTAVIAYSLISLVALVLVRAMFAKPAPASRNGESFIFAQLRGLWSLTLAVLGAVLGVNTVAFVMRATGHGMSWFSSEYSCLWLYGPPGLAGALLSQLLVNPVPESAVLGSMVFTFSFTSLALQLAGIGSGAMLIVVATPLVLILCINAATATNDDVLLWVYVLGQVAPIVTGMQVTSVVLDVFVPLTGRFGADAPADHIIASIVAFLGAYNFPLVVPFMSRFGARITRRAIFVSIAASIAAMAVFMARSPFDTMHQKRMFILHMENTTSSEQHLHIATADGAPGFEGLVHTIAGEFGLKGVQPPSPVLMSEHNPDWDVLYPFSQFLSPYKVSLESSKSANSKPSPAISVTAKSDAVDLKEGTRSLTMVINHTGVIWPTIAFDARVISWTLDDSPPPEHARHHVKGAAFYGEESLEIGLVIEYTGQPLHVTHVGIRETAMWPGKRAVKSQGGRAMEIFEALDAWIEDRTAGTVDATLLGCVGGATVL